jgi:lipopolysaccharide biosynthesis regulator YciM
MQKTAEMADKVKTIFNPNVGKYDVEADIGPAYATRRQEAFNAMSQILAQNKELVQIAGDLLFKYADFPGADEIAERLKRAVPPNILGVGPSQQEQQMQAQNTQLQNAVAQLHQQLQIAESKVKQGADDSQIKIYDAETRRMSAISQADAEAFKPVIRSLISEALGTPIVPIMHQHAAEEQAMQPQEPQPETVQ